MISLKSGQNCLRQNFIIKSSNPIKLKHILPFVSLKLLGRKIHKKFEHKLYSKLIEKKHTSFFYTSFFLMYIIFVIKKSLSNLPDNMFFNECKNDDKN